MNIGEHRKSVTNRRSGADRRGLLLTTYPMDERRCGIDRRTTFDRRLSRSIFESVKMPKRVQLCAIFKKGLIFGQTKKRALKQAPTSNRKANPDHRIERAYHRLPCQIPIKVLNCETHRFIQATARNYSDSGMYLESEYAPAIDSGIAIKMEKRSVVSAKPPHIPKYHSRVIWRKVISKSVDHFRYGIGVKHCSDLEEFLKLFSL